MVLAGMCVIMEKLMNNLLQGIIVTDTMKQMQSQQGMHNRLLIVINNHDIIIIFVEF